MNKIISFISQMRGNAALLFNAKSEIGILYVYRIISWVVTSAFYFLGMPKAPPFYKAGVVLFLLLSAILILRLYTVYNDQKSFKTIVIIETVGITILLIPTGGLDSPFIWYALNPVLTAACFLSTAFSWANLAFYCMSSVLISYTLFNPDAKSLEILAGSYSNVFLIFILITYAVSLLTKLLKRIRADAEIIRQRKEELEEINGKLELSNARINETMEHIMSLYQCVGALTLQSSKDSLLKMFSDYALILSKAQTSFFDLSSEIKQGKKIIFSGSTDRKTETKIKDIMDNIKEEPLKPDVPKFIICEDFALIAALVNTMSGEYGMIGITVDKNAAENKELYMSQLSFLAQLYSVVLERFCIEEVENSLMIAQEQNRIANEIHDSVSQRLFSIVCAIHSMTARWDTLSKDDLKEQLKLLRDCASSASLELRSCIYSLSDKKSVSQKLFPELRRYLDDMAGLNGLELNVDFSGNDEGLSTEVKKAINRIVREASGNAVRHGKCKKIRVSVKISEDSARVTIADDGVGLSSDSLEPKSNLGLGLNNMRCLAEGLKGKFKIKSCDGTGTVISVNLPKSKGMNSRSGGIAI